MKPISRSVNYYCKSWPTKAHYEAGARPMTTFVSDGATLRQARANANEEKRRGYFTKISKHETIVSEID